MPVAAPSSAGRIFGLAGLVGLAMILLFTSYYGYSEHRSLEENSRRDVASTAFFLSDHASRLFEVAEIALNGTATAVSDLRWTEIAASRDLQRQMRITADNLPQIEDIWLNDATGQLRATSFDFPSPRSDASNRSSFIAVRAGSKDLVVGDLIRGTVTKRETFLLARRLEEPDGTFKGMVSVTADLAYFSDYWSRVRLPRGSSVALVRASGGQVLAQFPPVDDLSQTAAPAIWTSFARDKPVEALPASADLPAGAIRQIAKLPLYIVVTRSQEGVDMAWRNWLETLVPFAAIAFLGLAGLTLAGYVQTRRETIAHQDLQRAQAELITVNANLEQTVAERTAELTESNEEIQRFAYIVSHDLRAPLVNIMGFTSELERFRGELLALLPQQAQEGETPPQEQSQLIEDFDEALGFIKSSIGKMDRLINAILNLSRQGGRRFSHEPIQMHALLQGIADAMAHQAMEADAELQIGEIPDIVSDRLAIEQIFSNLIDNALKYLKPGIPGRIRVAARSSGSYIVYEVSDNGRGVPPEDHKRIFELFRRSGVQDRQGEGIGLAHVKALVRRLGGIITVESALGEGSTFRVALPARPATRNGDNG